MLLFFAFLCFAILLAGWIVAPTTASSTPVDHAAPNAITEAGTSPA